MPTILITEDDHAISNSYAFKLRREGYDVLQAFDGVEMLSLLKANHSIDLVLLDLLMPRMAGDQVLEKMRRIEAYKMTPVIVLTNIGREEAPKTIWHLGIEEYVVKVTTTPRDVYEKIVKLLEAKAK